MSERKLPPGTWHQPGQTRVSPIPQNQRGVVAKLLLKFIRRKAGVKYDFNFPVLLLRLGGMFLPYLMFVSQLLMKGRIERADKERIILRTVWRLGCIYEWAHHAHTASELGVSEDEIRSLADEKSALWSERTRVLVQATDDLITSHKVGDEAWKRLRHELSEDQAVEFCVLVGHYVMASSMCNSFNVALEPGYLSDRPE